VNNIFQKLTSLGCRFAVDSSATLPDPEATIIEALDGFTDDKKIFTMMIGLLIFRLHHLINTQRLLALAADLDNNKKILLIVVCIKVARATNDQRYLLVARRLRVSKMTLSKYPTRYAEPFYLKRLGVDKDFKKFNVRLANFFEIQHEKKFKSYAEIYTENLWLKLRALIGPDFRADAIYLKASGRAKNQIEAARIIGCDKSSISRIWSSIKSIEDLAPLVS
jgi:transcriptional regulator with XRE-family HTH domain